MCWRFISYKSLKHITIITVSAIYVVVIGSILTKDMFQHKSKSEKSYIYIHNGWNGFVCKEILVFKRVPVGLRKNVREDLFKK